MRLNRTLAILATMPVVLLGTAARASGDSPGPIPEAGLRIPVRITAGAANQFLAVPSPDGSRIYFASDERATTELMVQELAGGGPRLLFDREADATWPRPSPDGRRVLYLSYRDDAAGDACVFDLPTRRHTCLTGPSTAEVQALWFPDGTAAAVQRDALHGNFRLVRLPDGGGAPEVVVDRSLSTPAVSPDGRVLAYVPLEQVLPEVGVTFAPRTGSSLDFQSLDRKAPARPWRSDLPGATGFPAFSQDGRWLYFTQYRNDTNGDGSIDGADHGVVFRVAFDAQTGSPQSGTPPVQLTSAAWNCQYPSPGRDALFVTCSREGSLDAYRLPLDGAVPPGWDLARLDQETLASRDPWERLLLMARALLLDADPAGRRARLRSLAFAEADVADLSSADSHARTLRRDATSDADAEEADALLELVDHRRDEQRFLRGAMPEDRFLALARARADRLRARVAKSGTAVVPMVQLALCEILDSAGDEGPARDAFRALSLAALRDDDLVRLYARRAVDLFRADGDRAALGSIQAALSAHPALPASDRLAFAERYVRDLATTRAGTRRQQALASALASAPPGSDLAFRLDLERRLSPLGTADPESVRKDVFQLYRDTQEPERRKVLARVTARRAAAVDADVVTYNFVNTWASGVRRDSADRKVAEALYRVVVLDRAWGDRVAGNNGDARGRFWEAGLQTAAPEAFQGFVEARLSEGRDDVQAQLASRFKDDPDNGALAYTMAYRIARDLPSTTDRMASLKALDAADALGRRAAAALPNSWEVHLLRGFLAHWRHRQTGDPQAAVDATTEYALALDLARDNPRGRASILLEAGILQASLGNTAAALRLLDERARLPFAGPASELAFLTARARSLFLADRDAEAADEAERAVALVDGNASLAPHLPRVLDRAALHAYAAGRFAIAADRYARLRPVAEAAAGTPDGLLNLARLDLALGAASLAAARTPAAVDALERARRTFAGMKELPAPSPEFPGRDAPPRSFDRLDLLVLATALEARALESAGRLDEASQRTDEVVELRTRRLAARDLDEDVLALSEAEYQRAGTAWRKGDRQGFLAAARASRTRAREYSERTGTPFPDAEVRALSRLAEACLLGDLPCPQAGADLGPDLRKAHSFRAIHRAGPVEADAFRLAILTTLWNLRPGVGPAPVTTPKEAEP